MVVGKLCGGVIGIFIAILLAVRGLEVIKGKKAAKAEKAIVEDIAA